MKKLLLIAAACGLSFCSMAQTDEKNEQGTENDKYCAEFADGVLYVVRNGEKMTSDVKLEDGTVIHTDAVIEKKNGSFVVMKPDQCIRLDGKLEGEGEPVTKGTAKK
jgi:hypothetical protein